MIFVSDFWVPVKIRSKERHAEPPGYENHGKNCLWTLQNSITLFPALKWMSQ